MSHDSFHLFTNPWNVPLKNFERNDNIYICLSGNSGVGKSTLINAIGKHIFQHDPRTIAIDEKCIHHPFLASLFLDAEKFAFQVQLNFMIQRSLLIKKWLLSGYNLIMERSHFEDRIFMTHLLQEGLVSKNEYDSYIKLWECITLRIPKPTAMILMDYPPELSIENVTKDEILGIRPKEFPNEEAKNHWLTSWFKLYEQFFNEMKNNNLGIKTFYYNEHSQPNELLAEIADFLNIPIK